MKSFFDKWCDQLWLYLLYLLAIIMGNILMLKWDVIECPRIPKLFACNYDPRTRIRRKHISCWFFLYE